jgi:large subunit ribosomal protein L25
MATAQLSASTRSDTGKGVARTLRRDGKVPGVIYGHAREAQPLAVDSRELERLLERFAASSTIIELDLSGTKANTLIREIQRHPVRRNVIHIDFQELVAGEKVVVSIPIVLTGTADGVRNSGGVLDQLLRQLSIRVDPANIPNHIDVDVTVLTIGHSIHVGDITVPEGVEVMDDEEITVATVAAPKAEAEVAPVVAEGEAAVAAEPELIRKPKAEEGEEEKK